MLMVMEKSMQMFEIIVSILLVWVFISNFNISIIPKKKKNIKILDEESDDEEEVVKKQSKPKKTVRHEEEMPSLDDIVNKNEDSFETRQPKTEKFDRSKIKIERSFDRLDNA